MDVAGHDDGGHPVGAQQGPARRGPPHQGRGAVHHHQAEPVDAVGGDSLGRVGHGRGLGGHQGPGAASGRIGGVGQPPEPRPVAVGVGGQGGDGHIGGTVEHRGLHHQTPGHCSGRAGRTDHADHIAIG